MSLVAALMIVSSIRAFVTLQPIVRAAPAGEEAAAYLVIVNHSNQDRLVGISCDCAERVEIHEMVGSGADRRMAVLEALDLPPARMVEIQPGGARHLMLTGLRRPLVAGEEVSLVLHFEREGVLTRSFRIVGDSRAAWDAQIAAASHPLMDPFAFLAGACWRGTFPDGRQTDTHCFSPIYNGSYMQDHHVVDGAPTPYSGNTLYRRDTMSRQVSFTYHASDGSRTVGRAIPIENGLSFPETHRAPDGTETQIRTTWLRDGADAFLVTSEMQRDGAWRTMLRMRMKRVGPPPSAPQ